MQSPAPGRITPPDSTGWALTSWGTALQRGPVGQGEQSQQSAPATMKVNCILSCSRSKKVSLYPTPMKQGLRALLYWGKQCRSTNSNKKRGKFSQSEWFDFGTGCPRLQVPQPL